jgi:hypothetical protein
MGNLFSLSHQPKSSDADKYKLSQQQRQQQLREKYGVLVPPIFIAATAAGSRGYEDDDDDNKEEDGPSSSSPSINNTNVSIGNQAHLQRLDALSSPSIVDHLWNTNTARTLLDEYMRPGLYFNVPTNFMSRTGSDGQILVALDSHSPVASRTSQQMYTMISKSRTDSPTLYPPPSRIHPHIPDGGASTTTSTSTTPTVAVCPPSPPAKTPIDASSPVSSSTSPFSSSFLSFTTSISPYWDVQLMAPMMSSFSSSSEQYGDECHAGMIPSVQIKSRLIPYTTLSARFNHNNTDPISANSVIVDEDTGTTRTIPSNSRTKRVGGSFGWMNATFSLPFIKNVAGMECVVGSWMTMESIGNLFATVDPTSATSTTTTSMLSTIPSSTRRYAPTTIHLQAAAEYEESLIATHIELPIFTPNTGGLFVPEATEFMVWSNLNYSPRIPTNRTTFDTATSTASSGGVDQQSTPTQLRQQQSYPPLWLAMKKSHVRGSLSSTYTLNLSQILTFDRPVYNILDDRAPMVRNHLGWVLQLELNGNTNQSTWRGGTSIQFNRNVAAKVVLDNNGSIFHYALILKRWVQPRATISILNSIDLMNENGWKHSILGLGVEIETMPTTITTGPTTKDGQQGRNAGNHPHPTEQAQYQERINIGGKGAPPTKIRINHPER